MTRIAMSIGSIEEVITAVEQLRTTTPISEHVKDYLELKRIAEQYYALRLLLEVVRRPDFKEIADRLPKVCVVPKGLKQS